MLKSSNISVPFSMTELLQLTHLGIPLEHITWARVTMTSDQWICIRHNGSLSKKKLRDSSAITVLNPHGSLPQTWQATASGARMNPQYPTIIVRSGCIFQMYDLESRKCIHRYKFPLPIHFWTWVNVCVVVIVSDTTVFHWDVHKGDADPQKIFIRNIRMHNAQLIQYTADPSMKWFALTGLIAEDNHVVGVTQVYSKAHNLCQMIDAHCVCFASYQFKGNTHPSCVLIAATRGVEKQGKLYIVELGPHLTGNLSYMQHTEAIEFTDLWGRYDFPTSIQVSADLGLVYLTTKYGLLHLYDLETCASLCRINVCPDIIFTTAFNKETDGIIIISRNGQVLSVDLKKDHLVKYVQEISKRPHVAERLSHVLKNS